MSQAKKADLKFFSKELLSFIPGIKRGLEKECLRVDKSGMIAQTPHPSMLGSSLMHPMITTDFSEALLEFITPPKENIEEMFQILSELHHFTYKILAQEKYAEYLWAASMPCKLPVDEQIPIAQFGSSNLGRLKYVYRHGLGLRYGRSMQTIAGIHFNFSLSDRFWQQFHRLHQSKLPLKDFISEQYLGLIRNALRLEWVLPYFFGASPAICEGFLKKKEKQSSNNFVLEKLSANTLYAPYGTSLRLSDVGYHNKTQLEELVSYNSFAEHVKTLHQAVHTKEPQFDQFKGAKEGEYPQLSNARLQIEDEHYAPVRAKRISAADERTLTALMNRGIEYIEVRSLDLNPFLGLGIEPRTIYFLDVFLIYCLLCESPPITLEESHRNRDNHKTVVLMGRKEEVTLINESGKCFMSEWLDDLFVEFKMIASLLDKAYLGDNYSKAIASLEQLIHHKEMLPSARIISEMKTHGWSYFDFISDLSRQHQKYFMDLPFDDHRFTLYADMAQQTLQDQKALEDRETEPFSEFLARYLEA